MEGIDIGMAFKPLGDLYVISYQGVYISINELKNRSWRKYYQREQDMKLVFRDLIRIEKLPKMSFFGFRMRHNTGLDTDNIVATGKLFVDMLRKEKRIPEDSKKEFLYNLQFPDLTLRKGMIIFEIDHIK